MRYTQKYLEENYSQEELNEVFGMLVRGGAGLAKGAAKFGAKLLGLGAGGAAFGAASKAGEGIADAGMAAAKKAGELALDPDQDRKAAAGFGGRDDITTEKGRRLSRRVGGAVGGFDPKRRRSELDKSLEDIVKRTKEAEEAAGSSDLETEFKKKRKKSKLRSRHRYLRHRSPRSEHGGTLFINSISIQIRRKQWTSNQQKETLVMFSELHLR